VPVPRPACWVIESKERFAIDVVRSAKVILAYLISPSLSIFLFATPLILALAVGRKAYRRWPLEASALVLAAAAPLLLLSCYASWSGLRAEVYARADRDAYAADATGV
jgi:hypothetical protein